MLREQVCSRLVEWLAWFTVRPSRASLAAMASSSCWAVGFQLRPAMRGSKSWQLARAAMADEGER